MDQAGDSRPVTEARPVIGRTTLAVVVALLTLERLITYKWNVPRGTDLAFLVLLIALAIIRVLARSQPSTSALRPLTLLSLAVAVVLTVMVVLSGAASDRWFLLGWVVPATTAVAERVGPRLPVATVTQVVACLLALVIVVQLAVIWQAHQAHLRANDFRDRLAQICADTAARSGGGVPGWITANEAMVADIETLNPPDQRTRNLSSSLIGALQGADNSVRRNDPAAKQHEWLQLAQQLASDLGIHRSCGVF